MLVTYRENESNQTVFRSLNMPYKGWVDQFGNRFPMKVTEDIFAINFGISSLSGSITGLPVTNDPGFQIQVYADTSNELCTITRIVISLYSNIRTTPTYVAQVSSAGTGGSLILNVRCAPQTSTFKDMAIPVFIHHPSNSTLNPMGQIQYLWISKNSANTLYTFNLLQNVTIEEDFYLSGYSPRLSQEYLTSRVTQLEEDMSTANQKFVSR